MREPIDIGYGFVHVHLRANCRSPVNVFVTTYRGDALHCLENLLRSGTALSEAEAIVQGEFPTLFATETVHNRVVDTGLNLIRDWARDQAEGLKRIAIGTGGTSPAAGNTQLGGEVLRDQFTDTVVGTSQITYKLYVASTQANGNTLQEAGIFGHSTATDTPNSGVLYCRATYTGIVKTSGIGVTYAWVCSWADDGV